MQKRIFLTLTVLFSTVQIISALGGLLPSIAISTTSERCGCNSHNDLKHFITGHDVKFPCQSTKNIYLSTGRYEPKNIIATRVQIGRDEAYVALPRLKSAVPFTLSKINLRRPGCTTPLEPYPCWNMQEEGNCDSLQSVVDLVLDQQEILWVLDTGIVNTLEQPIKRCGPKVVGIDTKCNKVVKRIDLTNWVTESSRLTQILVDYDLDGNSYIYVSDAGEGAILVHDCKSGQNHRVKLPGACVSSKRDVLYMVLVRKPNTSPFIYFTYLHSDHLFYIRAEHLRRGTGSGSVVNVGKKPRGHMILLGTDNGASVFLRFRGDGDIYMWNSEECFKECNFQLVQSGGDCRLSTQVAPGFRKFMWTIESNFQDYLNGECGCYGASIAIRPLVGDKDDD